MTSVEDLVAAHLRGRRPASVVELGDGCDNVAYEVDGDLIVRCRKEPDASLRAASVEAEARLLTAVAAISPLPVPEPLFAAPGDGCLAYRKLPGVPLLDAAPAQRAACGPAVAARLGELLAALHAAPVERMAELVERDVVPLATWRAEADENAATAVAAAVLPADLDRRVQAFLTGGLPAPAPAAVFSHNDLGIEHVLVAPATWTVTGIIDWTDAAIVDPARDLGLILRDLGPASLDAAIARCRPPAAAAGGGEGLAPLRERALFYARCSVLEDLAYGLQARRDRYVSKSLAALEWLFPA